MEGAPYFYDYINGYNSNISPSTIHASNTGLSYYFQRYLLQKAISVFDWKLPAGMAKNYFLYVLYCWGHIAILETDKYGVIAQACGLQGYDIYYQPRNAVITNPLLTGIKTPRIGAQCIILKLQPNYGGIMDIVTYYADMLALCAETIGTNLLNSKLSYVFGAENKAAAETFKKLYDCFASGEPATAVGKNLFDEDGNPKWNIFNQNLKQTYIASDLISDMRKIETMFCTDIGIPNANTDKRERLITDEVNANNFETRSKCALWLEELQQGCSDARAMFGIDISVDWRYTDNELKGGADIVKV